MSDMNREQALQDIQSLQRELADRINRFNASAPLATIQTSEPQGVFLACKSFKVATLLVSDLHDLLVNYHPDSLVINYGQVCKRETGFVLLYCSAGIPDSFEQVLQTDPDVTFYVIFNCVLPKGKESHS